MTLLWLLAAAPALVALATTAVPGPRRALAARLAPAAPLAAVPLAVSGPDAGTVELPWLLLGATLAVDELARPLLLVAAVLYAAALAAAAQAVPERTGTLAAFLLASWIGNAGVLVAADAATFALAFTLMTLSAYGLIVHDHTCRSRRAGLVYLVLAVLGEVAIVSGMLLAVAAGGAALSGLPAAVAASPQRDLTVGLLVAGFGVKAGLVPLHVWLPIAHPVAPSPASAVLSGCMVKAGLVGMLRFLPLGEAAMPTAGAVVGGLALTGALVAVVLGLTQREAKAVLAYSTVSQMGVHLVLVAVALTSPDRAPAAVAAAVLYATHHGLAKGALFLGVAVHEAYGASPVRRVVHAGLALGALAVAGAPLTSGAAAKHAAKTALHGAALAGLDVAAALPLVAVGSTLLLVRFVALLPRPSPEPVRAGPPGLLGAWVALLLIGAPGSWLLTARLLPAATGVSPAPPAAWAAAWAAAWPVVAGLAVAGAAAMVSLPRRLPHVPPGDVLAPTAAAATRAATAGTALLRAVAGARPALRPPSLGLAAVDRAEQGVTAWRTSGVALLAVLVVVSLLLQP